MAFTISGLPVDPFQPLFRLSDAELAERQIVRMTADKPIGFPCRLLLADAAPGDTLLLLNYEHQPAVTPYRSQHAIFVNQAATEPATFVDQVPQVMTVRKAISLRAFDESGMMLDADVVPGAEVGALIGRLFENTHTAYLHAHYAGRGCFAARIDRG